MPTYEYRCAACSAEHEAFQSITAEPLRLCPSCGEESLRRKVGGGASTLRFTGSGFYITDYARSKKESDSSCPCSGGKSDCSTES